MGRNPMRAIVVGAGPGGAIAALELARAGAEVRLVERSPWPRPKTCGDGISPLGVQLGRAAGIAIEGAVRLEQARVTTPRETAFRGGWPAATPWGTTIERHEFDALLVAAAVAAGAQFVPATAVRALANHADAIEATLASGDREYGVRADVAILAEGATGSLAAKLGFPPYRSRLVALRGYTDAPRALAQEYGLFYDRLVSPGYGWVFPIGERRANVGIAVDEKLLARRGGDLRALLNRWLAESRFARELLGENPPLDDLRGGLIPTGRKRRAAGRVFLVGDAAGVADPFTAEGIYEAMHSAHLAARVLAETPDLSRARKRYERELRVFDRNERTARAVRATFGLAIEPYAWRAVRQPSFAGRLNTDAFWPKASFLGFMWDLTRP